MIDTLELRIRTKLPLAWEMRQDGFMAKPSGFYKTIEEKSGCKVRLEAYNRFGNEFFKVRFSAPKLIYGNNIEMLKPSDLEFLPDTIFDIVARHSRIDFDASVAELTRLDFCNNWKLTSDADVFAYLEAMKTVSYPHKMFDYKSKGEGGVPTDYWMTKNEIICFYAKFPETAKLVKKGLASLTVKEKAKGILRGEHRFFNEKIKNLIADFGVSNRLEAGLPHFPSMAEQTLFEDMKILRLDKEIIGRDERVNRLREYCNGDTVKFEKLCGFIFLCDLHNGLDNIASSGDMNAKTVANRKTEFKKAGINLSKANAYNLPPLDRPQFESESVALDDSYNKTKLFPPQGISTIIQPATNLLH